MAMAGDEAEGGDRDAPGAGSADLGEGEAGGGGGGGGQEGEGSPEPVTWRRVGFDVPARRFLGRLSEVRDALVAVRKALEESRRG